MKTRSHGNLLTEVLLSAEDAAGALLTLSLPGLLARLSRGEATSLAAVQAHQQHAVHAFLVQLAALGLAHSKRSDPPTHEEEWRALLLNLAKREGAGGEAFSLVVDDLSKPAFLQPPVPEGTLRELKSIHASPSNELDVLITSKNHDVKMTRVDRPGVEEWVYSLISLQTMQGFLGAGNYGIARMNGGFASRPCVAFAADLHLASRFRRDLSQLLADRGRLLRDLGYGTKRSVGLVWCVPWDGLKSLSFAELDPFFIEVCRRIRLTLNDSGAIQCHRGSSKVARIDGKAACGNTGDPWTPVDEEGKALTLSEAGFHYDRVQCLMFDTGAWRHGAGGRPDSADRVWLAQVLVRGQGKTFGYHERWIPISPKVSACLADEQERTNLGKRAKDWVQAAGVARLKVLKPALLTLLQGAPEKLKFDDNRADASTRRFDSAVDDCFFQLLFAHLDDAPEDASDAFARKLFELAKAEFDRSIDALPVPSARRWRAEARARSVLFGAARKHLPGALPTIASDVQEDTQPGDLA